MFEVLVKTSRVAVAWPTEQDFSRVDVLDRYAFQCQHGRYPLLLGILEVTQ
jgi:hypothetical protein